MKEQLRSLLSAYLDGRLDPAERARVESALAQDPEARRELADLKELAELLDQAAPAPVVAPPELRAGIMARLKGEGPQPKPGGPSGRGPGWKPFVLGGAVLITLTGTFIALDRSQRAGTAPAPSSEWTDLAEQAMPGTQAWQPSWGTPVQEPTPAAAQADDIRTTASLVPSPQTSLQIGGDVFSFGQGAARSQPGRSGAGDKGSGAEVAVASGAGPNLESTAGWTPSRLDERLQQADRAVGTTGQDLLRLAQRHDLNPGLLAEAVIRFPYRAPTDLALTLRASLTATAGQTRAERLRRAVQALGGDPTRVAEWESGMK